MTGSYAAAGLIFLGLFLLGGAWTFYKNDVSKGMAVVLAICAAMAIRRGAMRW